MLTDEQVRNFRLLYKARYNKDIGLVEASEKGEKLVRLIKTIYKSANDKKS